MLGLEPHRALHAFMDEYSRELIGAHQILRHNSKTLEFARELYGEEGELEAALHIACDMRVVTVDDIQWAKTLRKGQGRRDSSSTTEKTK